MIQIATYGPYTRDEHEILFRKKCRLMDNLVVMYENKCLKVRTGLIWLNIRINSNDNETFGSLRTVHFFNERINMNSQIMHNVGG
jgi:hypothetical protein